MTDLQIKKSLLSCPGDSIQEHIDHIAMSQAELAERLGRSVPKLNELIKGKAPITKETAIKLEYVLGVPASFWLNLERTYQDELLEIEQLEHLERCQEWVSSFPLAKMKSFGLLPDTSKKIELADALLKFFRVASPAQWSEIYNGSSLAFKIELRHTAEAQAISVWLRLGELQADKIKVTAFDKKALRNCLEQIQEIVYEHSDTWLEELQSLCASCGLALVYTPCIAKAPIYGATRWIKNNSVPLIQITDRQKDYNAFWFTFFHELGHILYHGKKDIFIDGIECIQPDIEKEDEADAFAARMLLSEKERNELFQYPKFDKELILLLSKRFKKHPGIIVAQVQRQFNHLYQNVGLNSLKTKVEFTELSI
ncbi:HigA family addiction module antitoxin [Cyclobacterium qasimii]|uniref:HigA protein (Antitoxin to HigB) n=2 Tax=Cyclobacterium qasimii TaxID=1350429 RepID=S7WG18_9BACT|nr:HigA family addiction module antitoxin [Cyclobacterium qasimii]EPR65694.1 HigA protein (antitoxin to HigB) [Cyclobacterium qasimii M12-11B]GEO23570.1 XRE family transcriptional regulator [Cyclobacterium qasimii]